MFKWMVSIIIHSAFSFYGTFAFNWLITTSHFASNSIKFLCTIHFSFSWSHVMLTWSRPQNLLLVKCTIFLVFHINNIYKVQITKLPKTFDSIWDQMIYTQIVFNQARIWATVKTQSLQEPLEVQTRSIQTII
jgi:hypothetical protein